MTALEQLKAYLRGLESRLRLFAASRGAAVAVGTALALTALLVWVANRYKFADDVVLPVRILLFGGIAAAIVLALAIPLSRLNRRQVTRLAEERVADFKERLLTLTERPDPDNPFTELIAEDALRIAHEHDRDEFVPPRLLWSSVGFTAAAIAALLWMISGAAPGYWGYGAALLWTGSAHAGSRPIYDIAVQPGNKTIRRRSDQTISAQLIGFSSPDVKLHAKYRGGLKWEEISMQAKPDSNGYQFLFAGVSDSMDYYIQAGDAKSKNFTLGVKDLPAVKRVRVNLHYPSGIGLKDVVEDPGGDIRAVEGSQADVAVLTDRKLEHGVLVLESGSKIELLPGEGNWLKARIAVKKDGSYHVAAIDAGEAVRISDDYFIEARKDEPPTVKILRPGRDPRVTPIEELPITVDAADDFGVDGLELHYSVNGGSEQITSLLKAKRTKEAEGNTTLYLEDLKLVPGDVVSLYASARDATKTSRSDIVFVQAEPFDFKFRQSQQAGGGGGGGAEESNNISERQKEIIAATWNEMKDPKKEQSTLAQNAHFLSDLEGKLGEQAKALAERMGSRELATANPEFEQFSKAMNEASGRMSEAVDHLKPGKWQEAMPPEQKALQSLLHAESIFRDIQVAFGQQAGGGMGSSGAQRDLARMFDLELDTSKNQYETGQKAAPSMGGDQQKQIDEALQKLKDLAKRQQELAEQHSPQQQNFQQRWEEEQLRREAEQLRQQMEQLAQNRQPQGSQSQSQGSRSPGSQSQGSPSQGGGQSQGGQQPQSAQGGGQRQGSQGDMRQAMNALQRAEEEMRKSVSDHDQTAQGRAAQQLAEAQNLLSQMLQGQAANSVSDLAQKARQLADTQKDLANRVKRQYGAEGINTSPNGPTPGQNKAGLEMPQMDGPGFAGGWRRRNYREAPGRAATGQEKQLAAENEKLAQQLQQLQRQMQQQAQSMRGDQPEATSKLRQALSDAEQEELALRMEKNAEWLKQGHGAQTWPMQDSITAGMEQLSRQLQGVEQAARQSGQNGKPGGENGPDNKMAQALAQVRSLREQLENKSQQAGEKGQSGGEAGTGSQGDSPADSRSGSPSDSAASGSPAGGRPGIDGGGDSRNTIEQLGAIRSQLGRGDRQLNSYLNDAIGSLRHRNGQAGLLDERVNQDAVTSLERLEVELARRMGQGQADGSRIGAPETAPEKYRDAVAEYFRRLSK